MAIICAAAEKEQDSLIGIADKEDVAVTYRVDHAIASGAVHLAHQVKAKAIVTLTESGTTAFQISRYGLQLPIVALTPSLAAQRRMAMYRGVRPLRLETSKDHETALQEVEDLLLEREVFTSGDLYLITSGLRMREHGSTNTLQVMQVK